MILVGRPRQQESLATAAWVVVCGFVGWAVAALLLNLNFLLSVCAFAAAGVAAGRRLNAGWPGVLGFVVTFLIGNSVAFLPVMATQAMSGDETASQLASSGVFTLSTGYGIAAALGFLPVLRWSVKAYGMIVIGFALGGAAGGLLLGIAIGTGLGFIGGLALGIPLACGGFVAAEAASRGPAWGGQAVDHVRPAWLDGWRAFAVVALAGVLAAAGAGGLRQARETDGRARAAAPRNTPGGFPDESALYNGLWRLKEMPAVGAPGADPNREALEIYVAVRYRSRLKQRPVIRYELQSVADDIARRHADKTDEDLGRAAVQLGPEYLAELNRPNR